MKTLNPEGWRVTTWRTVIRLTERGWRWGHCPRTRRTLLIDRHSRYWTWALRDTGVWLKLHPLQPQGDRD
ncbi:MAG: hypothetical protein ACYDC1_17405 [Limisphaerales bacterium]